MPRLNTYNKMETFESSSHASIWMLSAIAFILFSMLIGLIFMG